MITKKITHGWVNQFFDTEKEQFVKQEFVAEDYFHEYEDENGNIINEEDYNMENEYLPYDMVQPKNNE